MGMQDVFKEETQTEVPYWDSLLRVYAGLFLTTLFACLFGVNMYVWAKSRINYKFIFEFDPRDNLDYHEFFEVNMHFLLFSGCFGVEFRDFFLADELNSLSYSIEQFEFAICAYANQWNDLAHTCVTSQMWITPFLTALPPWFRLIQCLRRYRDTLEWYPHLLNAGKYSSSLVSLFVYFSYRYYGGAYLKLAFIAMSTIASSFTFSWDVYMDWGLFRFGKHGGGAYGHPFLRAELVYSKATFYYLAIVFDFVGSRWVWNFFRLENEHLNNCGQFRAIKDIPLPFHIHFEGDSDEESSEEDQNDDEQAEVATLQELDDMEVIAEDSEGGSPNQTILATTDTSSEGLALSRGGSRRSTVPQRTQSQPKRTRFGTERSTTFVDSAMAEAGFDEKRAQLKAASKFYDRRDFENRTIDSVQDLIMTSSRLPTIGGGSRPKSMVTAREQRSDETDKEGDNSNDPGPSTRTRRALTQKTITMFAFVPHSGLAAPRRNHHHHYHPRATTHYTFDSSSQALLIDHFSDPFLQRPQQVYLPSSGDDTDEEELFLRAALERKRAERLARQQYRQQQQQQQREHQRLLEQQRYEALLRQEQARQLAIAQAHAQEEARKAQRARREAVAVFDAFVVRQQQDAHRARVHAIAEAKRQERKRQLQAALEREAQQEQSTKVDDSEGNTFEDPLSNLLEALFFPQQKRTQAQEESYPCKRRQQHCLAVHQHQHQQEKQRQKAIDQMDKEQEKVQENEKKQQQQQKQQAASPQEDFLEALPNILSFVEAVFGASQPGTSPSSSQACASACAASSNAGSSGNSYTKKTEATKKTATTSPEPTTTTAASSTGASPELKAADILRERQQRLNHQSMSLQQRHSELNLIESALDSFSRDLTEAIDGLETEENKKAVLSAEEGVSKAMFQIDSVESEGDLSVRQRRKELIKKSQEMLDRVDEFKSRETNIGKKVLRSVSDKDVPEHSVSASTGELSESESAVVVLDVEPEVENEVQVEAENEIEPADIVEALPEAELIDEKQTEKEQDQRQPTYDSDDEVIEPYNVNVPSPSPAESDTVQDDTEQAASVDPSTTAADETEGKKSADGPVPPAAASAEPAHDDYEIVPEF
ncbi:hypothetical protein BGX28_009870 [Mortierella sp. GBA30]|nr:hypothetical protein BGX28_009870 [Mortierella sp. GBA30]